MQNKPYIKIVVSGLDRIEHDLEDLAIALSICLNG